MQNKGSNYIVGYEVGFEAEINWNRPVLFNLAAIDRFHKTENGKARFTVMGSAIEPIEFVTKSSFEQVVQRLGAIE